MSFFQEPTRKVFDAHHMKLHCGESKVIAMKSAFNGAAWLVLAGNLGGLHVDDLLVGKNRRLPRGGVLAQLFARGYPVDVFDISPGVVVQVALTNAASLARDIGLYLVGDVR